MYKIETKGYDTPQKMVITKDYLLPKIYSMLNFKPEDVTLTDDIINHIITSYTGTEKGVRNLKRSLEILFTKLNLYRLTNGSVDESIQKNLKMKEVQFPYTVTRECIENFIKQKEWEPFMNLYT
jgi:ATP-dependent Lon protease